MLHLLAAVALTLQDPTPDPSQREIALPCVSPAWRADLVLDNGDVGIWTAGILDVFPQYAKNEVVGLDDLGRCHVLVPYSGKWTPFARCNDGKWLGGLCHGDVDPRVPGEELLVGGEGGNLYQVTAYAHGGLDCRLIAHFQGLELHTLACGDLDPSSPGGEVLVFTSPAHLYRVSPTGPDGTWVVADLGPLAGRVRDALVLPARAGRGAQVVTASRAGTLSLLSFEGGQVHERVLDTATTGRGRLALRPAPPDRPTDSIVLYSTLDDGRVLRHELVGDRCATETIHLGPQGLRGVAAGRFSADPAVETVAVFGYSAEVRLLSRAGDGPWTSEVLFVDRDRGHWLAAGELDGRNATDELVGSGYGGRIFVLYRPPGYGVEGVLAEPTPPGPSTASR